MSTSVIGPMLLIKISVFTTVGAPNNTNSTRSRLLVDKEEIIFYNIKMAYAFRLSAPGWCCLLLCRTSR